MPQYMRAFSAFDYHVRNHPSHVAVGDDSGDYSYAQLNDWVNRVRNGFLSLGLKPEDRVALVAKNRVEMLVLILASLKGGPVMVPVNRRVSSVEMLWIIRNAECSVIIADGDVASELNDEVAGGAQSGQLFCLDGAREGWQSFSDWCARQPETPASVSEQVDRPYLQIYTSGTSGRPKGVVLTETNCLAQQVAVQATLDVGISLGERLYQALPLFHVGGVFAIIWVISQGGCLILRQDFSPTEAEDLLASGQVAHAALVPAMIQAVLATAENGNSEKDAQRYSQLKTILYGASPISRPTLVAAMAQFKCDFAQIYGMSETHSVISVLTCADHREINEKPESALVRSAGRAAVGTQLSIHDAEGGAQPLSVDQIGEIRVRSDHVMREYWRAPEATAESLTSDDYLCTGDVGYVDADGYLFIVDRLKDVIVTGGENVSSLEVESVLMRHPDVLDAAVIAVPDTQWGEAVRALVVASKQPLDTEAIREFCRQELAGFKVPKAIEAIETIPRNPAGKILKAKLRQAYWGDQGRQIS